MKLFIAKTRDLKANEATIMAVLNGLQSNKQEYVTVSVNGIAYNLTKRFLNKSVKKDRVIIKNIKEGIQSLLDKKIITILAQNGDDYIFLNDGLTVDTEKEKFVVVELWELQTIFAKANKPFEVFDFFLDLVGTINSTTKEWHMPQDDMASLWGHGKRTVNDYLKQLSDMQLIYVYKHKKRRADGTYHKINNSYGRYTDKDSIIEAAKSYVNAVECEDVYERIDRRSIKLRYNAYCGGAKKYKNNFDLVAELYKECLLYNKSLKDNPVEGVYDGEWKKGEILDLSVFPIDIVSHKCMKKKSDDQWGEVDPMNDYNIEEMFDMPIASDVQSDDVDVIDIDSLYETDESLQDLY